MRIKKPSLQPTAFLFILFAAVSAKTDVLHWPELCRSGELQIKNTGATDVSVWLQKFGPGLLSETEQEVPAGSEISVRVEKIDQERYSLLHFNHQQKIKVLYLCGKNAYQASPTEGGVLTFPKKDISQFWLQNLYSDVNFVELEFQNSKFQKMTSVTIELKALAARLMDLPEQAGNWDYIKVTSSNRLVSFALNSTAATPPISIKPQQTFVDSAFAYFLVSARTGESDSFVVKIKDQKMADKARDLIKNPQKEKMLFARIQKNHQGFNRNFSTAQKNLWSWSTSEVTNFADLGSTACNGQPQLVEDRLDSWLNDPGQICFWNYRIKKELAPLEIATGILNQ